MGLLDNLNPNRPYQPCKVGVILSNLNEEDAGILFTALTDGRWTAFALARALKERGISITPDTLRDHMRGTCRCSKI